MTAHIQGKPVLELRKTQSDDADFLLKNPYSGYFADVGTGKTVVTLSTIRDHLAAGNGSTLLVSTVRVVENVWSQEIAKWGFDLDYGLVRGTPADRLEVLEEEHDIYAINFELLPWLLKEAGVPDTIDCLVIDESTKMKDSQTQRFQALRPALNWFSRRHILSGTPMPKNLEDLFGQIFILDKGAKLGSYVTHFRNKYFMKQGMYDWVPQPDAEDRVIESISTIVRRRAADPKDMPKVNVSDINVGIPAKALRVYFQMEKDELAVLDKEIVTAAHAGAAIMKLRQVCNGFMYGEGQGGARTTTRLHDAKLAALDDLLEDLQGEPLLVAYTFDEDAVQLKQRGMACLTGLSGRKAQTLIDRWNAGKLPAMAIHPASAGHGLNLQAGGHHIAFFGLDYNRELYDQAIGRLARTGQGSAVFVHRIVCHNTVEDVVAGNLVGKGTNQLELLRQLAAKRN